MLTNNELHEIAKLPTASFAVWNGSQPEDMEFFESRIERLHGRAVLLGLNPSARQEPEPLSNFHGKKKAPEKRLEKAFDGVENLQGCYLSDVFQVVESDSAKVDDELAKCQQAIRDLQQEFAYFPQSTRHVIAMGNKAFEALCLGTGTKPTDPDPNRENLRVAEATVGDEHWHIWRIWHIAGYRPEQLNQIADQLRYIDSQVAGYSRLRTS